MQINLAETTATATACVVFANELHDEVVHVLVDNTSALSALRDDRGKEHTRHLAHVARTAAHMRDTFVSYVATALNLADKPSRYYIPSSRAQGNNLRWGGGERRRSPT